MKKMTRNKPVFVSRGMVKNIIVAAILGIMILSMAGCKKKEKVEVDVNNLDQNSIAIYYPNEMELAIKDEVYQLKQPDSISSSVDELLNEMSDFMNEYGFEVTNFMVDSDNVLKLTLTKPSDISKENILLTKASICNTLFQIPNLKGINLVFQDKDNNVSSAEAYNRESFYIYQHE